MQPQPTINHLLYRHFNRRTHSMHHKKPRHLPRRPDTCKVPIYQLMHQSRHHKSRHNRRHPAPRFTDHRRQNLTHRIVNRRPEDPRHHKVPPPAPKILQR
ncbi:hypothetical protein HanIR_Chr05g0251811 [Helianthus annuus]|nr:hypothetical protein HanIR_Chr05g0251811 [Helianthus annuus]